MPVRPEQPTGDLRSWADTTLIEIVEAHPVLRSIGSGARRLHLGLPACHASAASVVVTTYAPPDLLAIGIDLLHQTLADLEVVLVVDGDLAPTPPRWSRAEHRSAGRAGPAEWGGPGLNLESAPRPPRWWASRTPTARRTPGAEVQVRLLDADRGSRLGTGFG